MRRSGILMHISSLPNDYGIGKLGKEAYAFVDFLEKAHQKCWQILPISPTSYGDSPYQSFSVHAGNPYFIDLEALEKEGYLKPAEYKDIEWGDDKGSVDYGKIYEVIFKVLRTAHKRFRKKPEKAYSKFVVENKDWIYDYALFMSLKFANKGKAWYEWDEPLKMYKPKAIKSARKEYANDIDFWCFVQYKYFQQWKKLKAYANEKGIEIIGDIPIYVAYDSVEVWSTPQYFSLDKEKKPVEVAGCPPDAFTADGQLWGNPIYDWDAMEKDNYSWWVSRIGHSLKLYDTVRIDHFRAFASYWAVPAESKTAKIGEWLDGPKMKLFNKIFDAFPNAPIIAEDLGVFGEDVVKLLADTGFPGMKVVQFGFDPNSDSSHMPHNAVPNSINYVGTHDNNTILGWLWEACEEERKFALEYCGFYGDNWGEGGYYSASCRKIIETVWKSSSNVAIIALQDMCGFGSDARMNIPGVPDKNWRFRTTRDTIDNIDTSYFKHINSLFRRMYPAFDDKENK